jgi:peptidoglycan/LPS O-acetylase OafA/YrhL
MSGSAAGGRRRQHSYYRGLDGLRGLAVLAVVLYHGGVSWAQGGFLGVEAFFVLSGFLITSLLVAEWERSRSIELRAFWARRARRLLPGLLCLVSVIGIYYAVAGPSQAVPGLKGDGLSTLLYAGNWHQISTGSSYFAAGGPVSPLKHTWSLAIEEQFYLFWPLLLLGVLWLVRRRVGRAGLASRKGLRLMLALSVGGAVASAIDTAFLFRGGSGLDRVYYGTDTRAGSLLAGAALALALALFREARERRERLEPAARAEPVPVARVGRRLLGPLAGAGLLAVIGTMLFAHGGSRWLYPYGLVGVDVAMALVIAAVVLTPGSLVGRALSWMPLRALGVISYGVYLWHFPLFLWLDANSTGLRGTPLLMLRLTITLVVSVASFVLIEHPVRRHTVPTWLVRWLTPAAAAGAAASILFGSTLAGVPVGEAAAAVAPKAPAGLAGGASGCAVALNDTARYGLAPYPPAEAGQREYAALTSHELRWSGSSVQTFHTCPPKRVLLVGDSLAYTLGVGMMQDEEHYGVELGNAAVLGCAFTTSGEIDIGGSWEGQSPGCPTALQQWSQEAQTLDADAVIVELGYRDQFDWRWGDRELHLGQAAFDAYVQRQIAEYASVLGRGGAKVLFLSVPWSQPPPDPNGSPAAAASADRHAEINALLQAAARNDPSHVGMVDIDAVVSPGNRYQASVNGQACRFDGIHFTLFCSRLLEPAVLGTVRKMIGS